MKNNIKKKLNKIFIQTFKKNKKKVKKKNYQKH